MAETRDQLLAQGRLFLQAARGQQDEDPGWVYSGQFFFLGAEKSYDQKGRKHIRSSLSTLGDLGRREDFIPETRDRQVRGSIGREDREASKSHCWGLLLCSLHCPRVQSSVFCGFITIFHLRTFPQMSNDLGYCFTLTSETQMLLGEGRGSSTPGSPSKGPRPQVTSLGMAPLGVGVLKSPAKPYPYKSAIFGGTLLLGRYLLLL